MKIEKWGVEIYKQKAMCINCTDVEMERSNVVLLSSPKQYKYKCQKCNYRKTSTECYPKIVIE